MSRTWLFVQVKHPRQKRRQVPHHSFRPPHTCDAVIPTITRAWVYSKAVKFFGERPNLSVAELSDLFLRFLEVRVSTATLERCRREVTMESFGDKVTFGMVRSFLEAFVEMNPGSTTSWKADGDEFQRAFLCPALCKNAFNHSTRVIALDACHVKARYGGVILVLTVLDGDGRVFPAVLGLAESENAETWSWFLQQVCVALEIGNGNGIVVLSDREKGIENAVAEFLPRANHSFCVFHIQKTSRPDTKRHWTISFSLLRKLQQKGNSKTRLLKWRIFMRQLQHMSKPSNGRSGQAPFPCKTIWPCYFKYGRIDESLVGRGSPP